MDKRANNVIFALWLSAEVKKIIEADPSNTSWALVDKKKLPAQCFLWVEDRTKKSTWHLPYREGTGGIDPETGLYRKAGPVNLNALRAIAQAMGGARTGTPMTIPKEIKSKIDKLLKEYGIGESKHIQEAAKKEQVVEIRESSIARQMAEIVLDKKERLISGVVLLHSTSGNIYIPGSKGTRFSEGFMRGVSENINGKKFYMNHVSDDELKKHNGVRSVGDVLGYYENGRIEAGVPKADIRYLSVHAPLVESLVEEMSDKIGLSIVARGDMMYDKASGIAEAYNLKQLFSADLVTEPGSTANMFESNSSKGDEMDESGITMEMLNKRPDLIAGIRESVRAEVLSEAEQDGELNKLKVQIATLTEDNKRMKKEVDEFKVKEAAGEKAAAIAEEVKESKIPDEYITEAFKESLSDAKDKEARKALLEDRKALIEGQKKKGVTGMGDGKVTESEKLTDEEYTAKMELAIKGRG
jgi:hypothetical protein